MQKICFNANSKHWNFNFWNPSFEIRFSYNMKDHHQTWPVQLYTKCRVQNAVFLHRNPFLKERQQEIRRELKKRRHFKTDFVQTNSTNSSLLSVRKSQHVMVEVSCMGSIAKNHWKMHLTGHECFNLFVALFCPVFISRIDFNERILWFWFCFL